MFWHKLVLLKPIFYKKFSNFSLIFPFYKHMHQECPVQSFLSVYVFDTYSTKVEQFKLIKDKKRNSCYSFICGFPIRYVNGGPESKILSLKYPPVQLLIETSQFYVGSWHKLLKSKRCYFLT